MNRFLTPLAISSIVLGCSEKASDKRPPVIYVTPSPPTVVVPPAPPPEKPKPQYADRDRDVYLYTSALSDEEEKEGKGVGRVIAFKFLGEEDGIFTVASLSEDEGTIVARSRCANPCKVITQTGVLGKRRIEFSETTVIGSAFADAFNGHLRVAGRPATKE